MIVSDRAQVNRGWEKVKVGKALRLINGRAFKPSEWRSTGIPIIRIQNLNNPEAPFNYYDGDLPEKFLVDDGNLLFAWSGTPGTSFGAHIWRGGRAWLNQHIFKVLFDETDFDKRFLQLAINQNLDEYIRAAHGAAGLAHITKGRFEESELPKPDVVEQVAIVAEIEKQFTRLEAGVAGLRRVQANLKRYRAAVLKAGCEGKLVPTEADRWTTTTLGSVLTTIEAGISFRCEERPPHLTEIGVVKVSAVTWGTFDERETKTCLDKSRVDERYFIWPGDFLFSRANTIDLVGACVIVSTVTLKLMLSDKILRFRFAEAVMPQWVLYWLRSEFGRKEIQRLSTGNQESMRNIGQDRIRQIAISVPPLADQQRIVAEAERRLSVVDELEAVVNANLRRATRLRQSILQRAFEGRPIDRSQHFTEGGPSILPIAAEAPPRDDSPN